MARTQTKQKRSSSHAQARLEERLPPAVAERGYELLRDREALADLIARAARDDPRIDENERVALALAPRDPCAHLVATRAGDGVTTLAAGMAHTLPTVPFTRVSAFLESQATLLQASIEVHKNLAEDERSPLVRAFCHPHRVTREEFERLRKLAPLFCDLLREHVVEATDATMEVTPPRRPWSDTRLDALWRLYMRGALFLTLDGFDCPIQFLLRAATACDVALSGRAIWHMANRPEETLDAIARGHEEGLLGEVTMLMAALYVLPAVATRQPAYEKDALRLAAALTPAMAMPGNNPHRHRLVVELAYPLVVYLPQLMPAPWRDLSEATEERLDRAARIGAETLKARDLDVPLLELAEAISPWHAETVRALDPLRDIGAPRQTRVRATSSLDSKERVRVAMWRGMLRERALPLRGTEHYMAMLLSLAPLEALAPLDDPDPTLSLSHGRTYLTRHLFQMRRMSALAREARERKEGASKSDAPLVSQNAPCLCGSGKKLKRCCGRSARRLRRAR